MPIAHLLFSTTKMIGSSRAEPCSGIEELAVVAGSVPEKAAVTELLEESPRSRR